MLHSITLSQKLRTILTDKESQSRRSHQDGAGVGDEKTLCLALRMEDQP